MTLKELLPTVTVEQAGQMLGISRRSALRDVAAEDRCRRQPRDAGQGVAAIAQTLSVSRATIHLHLDP